MPTGLMAIYAHTHAYLLYIRRELDLGELGCYKRKLYWAFSCNKKEHFRTLGCSKDTFRPTENCASALFPHLIWKQLARCKSENLGTRKLVSEANSDYNVGVGRFIQVTQAPNAGVS